MRPLTIEHVESQLVDAMAAQDWPSVDRLSALLDDLDERERDRRESVALGSAALWYASRGLHVFPLQPMAKLPYRRSRGCHDATTDVERIARWWQRAPESNVAIATGHLVDVIDIDGPTGVRSYASAENLPHVLGKVSTPRAGGLHLYVPAHDAYGNRARLAEGIDYRGSGGYVVAPPSRTEDGRYHWIVPLQLERERERSAC